MKKFLNEFKEFAMKGNVIDMAIGVIIGGAFGKIVTSLVNDIITPLISLLTGSVTLTELKHVFKPEVVDAVTGEVTQAEVALAYGNFLQAIIDFLLIALSIFIVLKIIMKAKEKLESMKKAEEVAEEEEADTELSVLLEIRDYLKKEEAAEDAE